MRRKRTKCKPLTLIYRLAPCLNPDYVAARSLRSLRSNKTTLNTIIIARGKVFSVVNSIAWLVKIKRSSEHNKIPQKESNKSVKSYRKILTIAFQLVEALRSVCSASSEISEKNKKGKTQPVSLLWHICNIPWLLKETFKTIRLYFNLHSRLKSLINI